MLHAHDMVDQRVIQNGQFVPAYIHGSVEEAIKDIVKRLELMLVRNKVKIKHDAANFVSTLYPVL